MSTFASELQAEGEDIEILDEDGDEDIEFIEYEDEEYDEE